MMRRLFGTDGIRGIAGEGLGAETAMLVGRAVGTVLSERGRYRPKVVIGADTRASSQMLVSALTSGLFLSGADVIDLGIAPTPAVAYLTLKNNADAGIVVSASHNPYQYNGIKIFGQDGFKIPDGFEERIEVLVLDSKEELSVARDGDFGKRLEPEYGIKDYVNYLKGTSEDLNGLRVVIDCANGACAETAGLFAELSASCHYIGNEPNGRNINESCGSTSLGRLREEVLRLGADVGIAFDGDGDRCLAIDENGREVDGDFLMAIMAKRLKMQGKLYKNTVVGTVMTNLGFIKFCENNGINYCSTKVGDRYVLEMMEQEGYSLGGEQSGHIILRELATTGDGQLSALFLLGIMKAEGKPLSELCRVMKKYPQRQTSVEADADRKLAFQVDRRIKEIIEDYEKKNPDGRLVVRASGTEPVIRIMVEGADSDLIKTIADGLKKDIEERLSQLA